jgi:hypothetical protein
VLLRPDRASESLGRPKRLGSGRPAIEQNAGC